MTKITTREIVEWFLDHYEDPIHNTPRDSGEWVWIWGGPYDAREEIEDKFPHVPERVVNAAVRELEEDFYAKNSRPKDGPDRFGCTEWSGKPEYDEEDAEPFEIGFADLTVSEEETG